MTDYPADQWKIVYKDAFRKLLRENKGSIKTIQNLLKELEGAAPGTTKKEGPVSLMVDQHTDRSDIYVLTIRDKKFFLKVQHKDVKRPYDDFGYSLAKNMEAVKEALKDIPWARTIESHLGYTDLQGNNYYVAEWIPSLENLEEFMGTMSFAYLTPDKKVELKSRVLYLMDKLRDFRDVQRKNMYYNPDDGTFVLFDLMSDPKKK